MSGGIWNPGQRPAIEVERLRSENEEMKGKFREIESRIESLTSDIKRICREALSKNEETP